MVAEQSPPHKDEMAFETPPVSIYCRTGLDRELRQGEIISDLVQYSYDFVDETASSLVLPYAIIASQDCDLLQDYNVILDGKQSTLNGILLFEAQLVASARGSVGGSDIWKRIRQNKDERYHLLQNIPAECDTQTAGIDTLLIDFRRIFTIAPTDLYRQIEQTHGGIRRRSRLEMPYREHLQSRAAYYFGRVGVPEPHRYEVTP